MPYIPVGNAHPPFSTPQTQADSSKPGHLVVHGKKTRYVESNLWKVVSAEASQDALESSSDEDEGPHRSTNISTGDVGGGLILGFTEPDERSIKHPDAATILRLWQIFLDNCNPVSSRSLPKCTDTYFLDYTYHPRPICPVRDHISHRQSGEHVQATMCNAVQHLYNGYSIHGRMRKCLWRVERGSICQI